MRCDVALLLGLSPDCPCDGGGGHGVSSDKTSISRSTRSFSVRVGSAASRSKTCSMRDFPCSICTFRRRRFTQQLLVLLLATRRMSTLLVDAHEHRRGVAKEESQRSAPQDKGRAENARGHRQSTPYSVCCRRHAPKKVVLG